MLANRQAMQIERERIDVVFPRSIHDIIESTTTLIETRLLAASCIRELALKFHQRVALFSCSFLVAFGSEIEQTLNLAITYTSVLSRKDNGEKYMKSIKRTISMGTSQMLLLRYYQRTSTHHQSHTNTKDIWENVKMNSRRGQNKEVLLIMDKRNPTSATTVTDWAHSTKMSPRPSDIHDSDYFKDKMPTKQAQESGAVSWENSQCFLAGEQVPM
ncbi:hypothetical protein Tco_1345171 [Tanacetum coccineum]